MAPADAPFYGEAVVRPEGAMLDDFNSAFGTLLGTEDPSAMLRDQIEQELADSEEGVSYTEDIEPWLGARVGGFVTDVDPVRREGRGRCDRGRGDRRRGGAGVHRQAGRERRAAPDRCRATTASTTRSTPSEGSAVGINGDFLIAGTEQGFKDAVDAGAGDSLAESETATTAATRSPTTASSRRYVDTSRGDRPDRELGRAHRRSS